MSENKKVKMNNNYYFPICIAIGVVFGVIFKQLATGISIGTAIGAGLSTRKKK